VKFYKPLFSIIVIIVQLILSLKEYYEFIQWGNDNPELNELITRNFLGNSLFLFVLIIGIYEMLTKPGWLKNIIRIFLVSIVISYHFSGIIPVENFKFGVYNTAWFSSVIAFVLILIQIVNYRYKRITDKKTE
jgi:hypothetical protein